MISRTALSESEREELLDSPGVRRTYRATASREEANLDRETRSRFNVPRVASDRHQVPPAVSAQARDLVGTPPTAERDALGDLLTLDEVVAWLRVPRSWIYERTRKGQIPHLKLGKYLRFHRQAVEAWLAGQRPRSLERD